MPDPSLHASGFAAVSSERSPWDTQQASRSSRMSRRPSGTLSRAAATAGPRVRSVLKVLLERPDRRARRVTRAIRETLAMTAFRVLLEILAGRKVLRETRVQQDLLAQLAPLVRPVLKGSRATPARPEQPGRQAQLARLGQQAQQAQPERLVLRVQLARQARQVTLVPKVILVMTALTALTESTGMTEHRDRPEPRALQARPARQVRRVPQVQLDQQARSV